MKIRYLGINGFEFKENGFTLLIDPYVSRDPEQLCFPDVVRKHIPEADAIFIGHTHWDHAADVGEIMGYTNAVLYGSETMINIGRSFQIPEERLRCYENRRVVRAGPFSVTPFKSLHNVPMRRPGVHRTPPPSVRRIDDYVEGGTWALCVECGGISILNVGSANFLEEELKGQRCDYLMAAVRVKNGLEYARWLLSCVSAKTVIPAHWDDYRNTPVDATGARPCLATFIEQIKTVDPAQDVRVLQVLETLEIPSEQD